MRWHRLTRYALKERRGLLVLLTLMVLGVAAEALKPWPLKLIVDHVLTGEPIPGPASWLNHLPGGAQPDAMLAWLAGATLAVFLVSQGLQVVQGYVQAGVSARMSYALGASAFSHLQRLSLRFHGRRPTGDLVRRITSDSDCVRKLVMGVALPVLTSVMSVVTMVAVLWQLDRALALVAVAAAPLLAILMRFMAPRMTERNYRLAGLEGEVMALSEQALTALPVVQAFRRQDVEDRRFQEVARRTVRAAVGATGAQMQFKLGVSIVTALGTAAILLFGGMGALQGDLKVGSLLVFLAYLASLYAPMETLAFASSGFAAASAGARRVFEVLDAEDRVQELPGARRLRRPEAASGEVRLEGVTFGYEPGRPVLKAVDLTARPGETIAMVGATGAGKSTIASLLVRFFDPWEGQVTIGGADLRELTLESLRENVALVLQDPFLLPVSVAENIAYGRPHASRDEIVAAAMAAKAHDFICAMPEGYDTVLGERGSSLSGGQRQRIAIARALLKDSPIVILDEPTSALDVETEREITDALESLRRDRTTILIAHRLSTVERANRIIVLDDGKVCEAGSHADLIALGGKYSALLRSQLS